jgi:hypothetical protein
MRDIRRPRKVQSERYKLTQKRFYEILRERERKEEIQRERIIEKSRDK